MPKKDKIDLKGLSGGVSQALPQALDMVHKSIKSRDEILKLKLLPFIVATLVLAYFSILALPSISFWASYGLLFCCVGWFESMKRIFHWNLDDTNSSTLSISSRRIVAAWCGICHLVSSCGIIWQLETMGVYPVVAKSMLLTQTLTAISLVKMVTIPGQHRTSSNKTRQQIALLVVGMLYLTPLLANFNHIAVYTFDVIMAIFAASVTHFDPKSTTWSMIWLIEFHLSYLILFFFCGNHVIDVLTPYFHLIIFFQELLLGTSLYQTWKLTSFWAGALVVLVLPLRQCFTIWLPGIFVILLGFCIKK